MQTRLVAERRPHAHRCFRILRDVSKLGRAGADEELRVVLVGSRPLTSRLERALLVVVATRLATNRHQSSLSRLRMSAMVVAGCREHGIGAITVPSPEEVLSEVAVALHVSDHELDGRSSLEARA
jgi:hypothetical protein